VADVTTLARWSTVLEHARAHCAVGHPAQSSSLEAAHVSELSDVRGDHMLSSSVRPFGVGGTAGSAFLAGGITAL
jgi:hypothetical protein